MCSLILSIPEVSKKSQKKLIKTQLEDVSCIHYSIVYTSVKFQATTAAILSTDPV